MKIRILIILVLFVLIVAGVAALVFIPAPVANAPTTTSSEPASLDDLITVSSPLPGALVSSPLTLSGQARGSWYFEASAPVKILDSNGNTLAQAPLKAEGDWMTADYVPFTGVLSFPSPETATGTLVLMNDNPSGDPARQKELRIPVRFR